jgi:hypothetical protein
MSWPWGASAGGRQPGQTVQTGPHVRFRRAVVVAGLVVLAAEVLCVQRPLLAEVQVRHGEPATVADALGGDDDDGSYIGARAHVVPEVRQQRLPAGVVTEHRLAPAVHPHHGGRAGEGSPQQGDSSVLPQVGYGLGAAAAEVPVLEEDLSQPRAAQVDGVDLQRRNTTRRITAPNASTPASRHESAMVSSPAVSAKLVPTRRSPPSHTSLSRAWRRLPPVTTVSVTARSRGPADGALSNRW